MQFKKINLSSIRNKLIITLILVCLIPLVITGTFSYNQSKSILNNKLNLTSTQTLTEINSGLVDYFQGFINIITTLSSKSNIVNVNTGDNFNSVPDILKNLVKAVKIF